MSWFWSGSGVFGLVFGGGGCVLADGGCVLRGGGGGGGLAVVTGITGGVCIWVVGLLLYVFQSHDVGSCGTSCRNCAGGGLALAGVVSVVVDLLLISLGGSCGWLLGGGVSSVAVGVGMLGSVSCGADAFGGAFGGGCIMCGGMAAAGTLITGGVGMPAVGSPEMNLAGAGGGRGSCNVRDWRKSLGEELHCFRGLMCILD